MAERTVNFRGRTSTQAPGGRGRGINNQTFERRPVSIEREYVSFEENNSGPVSRGRQPKVHKPLFEGRYFEKEPEGTPKIQYATCPKCKGGRFMVSVIRSQDWYLCQNCRGSGLVDVTDVWDLEVKRDMVFYANKGCKVRTHLCTSCHKLEELPVKEQLDGFIPFSAVCTNKQRRYVPKTIQKDGMEWASRGYDPETLNDVLVVTDNEKREAKGLSLPPPKKTPRLQVSDVIMPAPPLDRRDWLDQLVTSPPRGLASRHEVTRVYSTWTAERRTIVSSVVRELETLHGEILETTKKDLSTDDLIGLIKGTIWSLMDPRRNTPCSMLRQMWAEIITRVKLSIPEEQLKNLWLDQLEDPSVIFERRLSARQLAVQFPPRDDSVDRSDTIKPNEVILPRSSTPVEEGDIEPSGSEKETE